MVTALPPIRVLATRWCGDCRMARRILDESGVPYAWVDIDHDPDAQAEVLRLNRGMRSVPTIIFADGSILVEPSRRALTGKLSELAPVAAPQAPVAADQCAVDTTTPRLMLPPSRPPGGGSDD